MPTEIDRLAAAFEPTAAQQRQADAPAPDSVDPIDRIAAAFAAGTAKGIPERPLLRHMPGAIAGMERDAQRLETALAAAREDVAQRLAGIDPRFATEHRAEIADKFRAAFAEQVTEPLLEADELEDALRAQLPHYTPAAVRSRAVFDADPVTSATLTLGWRARLDGAERGDLIEVAREAAATKNLALAREVQKGLGRALEAQPEDAAVERALLLLSGIPLPPVEVRAAETIRDTLRRLAGARMATNEALTGNRDTHERLALALSGEWV